MNQSKKGSVLNSEDEEFVNELRTLLKKHNNIDRFGLSLLHNHFPISEDEILIETNNTENMTLTSQVFKKSEVKPDARPSYWRIDESGTTTLMKCLEHRK